MPSGDRAAAAPIEGARLTGGPPNGRAPIAIAILLASAGLVLLIIGGRRDVASLTLVGSVASALALFSILYWRATLVSYWQTEATVSVEEGKADSANSSGREGDSLEADAEGVERADQPRALADGAAAGSACT